MSGTLTITDIQITKPGANVISISSGVVSETLSRTLQVGFIGGTETNTPLTIILGNSPAFPVVGYILPSSVTIQSGESSVTFVVSTVQDNNVGDNVFSISGTCSGFTVTTGTLTVTDISGGGLNGNGSTTLTISSSTVSETLSTVLNLSLPSTINVTTTPLTLTLLSNVIFPGGYSADDGRGAQSLSGTNSFMVVIPANQHSVSFTIQTARDGNVGNNTFILTGSSVSYYTFLPGILTVQDVDVQGGLPTTGPTILTISSGMVSETLSKVLSVSLPGVMLTNTPLILTITSDIPFLSGYQVDQVSVSGSTSFTVVIQPNQHSVNFTIQTASDTYIPDNIFHLGGASLPNYVFITGTLTVINTDARRTPVLTIISPNSTYVGGSFTASVSSTAMSSGGPITYSAFGTGSGSATVDASTGLVTGYRVGQVILRATSSGDTNYNGVFTTQVLTITKGTPTLSLTATNSQVNVDGSLQFTAMSYPALSGGLTSVGIIQYSIVSGSATIDQSGLLHAIAVGPVVVQASQAPDANYYAPLSVTQTITINPAIQSITITSADIMSLLSSITVTATSSATGGRGGSISYTIINGTGQAMISGTNVITASLEGTVTLHASTAGDANYSGASADQTITIVSLALSSLSSTLSEGSNGILVLSLRPLGMILPEGVTFTLSGSVASSGHYSLPSTVFLAANQGSVSVSISGLADQVLFNDELLVIKANNIYLNSVSGSLTITDSTAQDARNRVITLGSGTIFQSQTRELMASLPAGITSALPISVSLSINEASDLSLLAGPPVVDSGLIIPIGGNFGSFSVTASSNNDQPAHILIDGNSLSFTVIEGVVTVINKKIDLVPALSDNYDGIDDCLLIGNIERYPDNRVDVVDRQGLTVYSISGYNNTDRVFCGVANVGVPYHLPSGPYYYVIRLIDRTKDKNNDQEEKFYSYFKVKASK